MPSKGEGARRIWTAVRMLETGNYLVPQVGSNPYYRKPPLVNWLVAASFKLFGVRNEWTARLPSALSVLLVAIAFVTVARATLGARGSIVAAMIWLTNIGIIEKGRVLERLAGSYSSCTFCRARRHDWGRGGMGNSIRPRHDIAGCDRQMVGSVHRTAKRHRFQIPGLDPKRPA